jgi:hypothetical protein
LGVSALNSVETAGTEANAAASSVIVSTQKGSQPISNMKKYIGFTNHIITIFFNASVKIPKISSIAGPIDRRNSLPIFKRVQSRQILLMNDYLKQTSFTTICNRCKTNLAEIFQDNGDYCLHCRQEITCPNV